MVYGHAQMVQESYVHCGIQNWCFLVKIDLCYLIFLSSHKTTMWQSIVWMFYFMFIKKSHYSGVLMGMWLNTGHYLYDMKTVSDS